jgi:hypothetical protein
MAPGALLFVPPDSSAVVPWNRLLKNNFHNGSFQPFGHAERILADNNMDWLCKARHYLPVDAQTDYLKLKYRMF